MTRKSIACLMVICCFFFLTGCSGKANEAMDGKFSNNERWTEQTYDMMFDVSNSYTKFENSMTIITGRIIASECELVFNVSNDISGNLLFVPLRNSDVEGYYFKGWFRSADENTYSVKVDSSKIPEIMPDGTILTFTIEDIAAEDLYIPEALGGLKEGYEKSGDGEDNAGQGDAGQGGQGDGSGDRGTVRDH